MNETRINEGIMSEIEMGELDAWIAENVMGWKLNGVWHRVQKDEFALHKDGRVFIHDSIRNGVCLTVKVFDPTTDPAAAMEVLKRCAGLYAVKVGGVDVNNLWMVANGLTPTMENTVRADTLELAICLFARKLFTKPNQPKE